MKCYVESLKLKKVNIMVVNIIGMKLEAQTLKEYPINKDMASLDQIDMKDTWKDTLSNDDDHQGVGFRFV